jgi:hypothetical protein
MTEKPDLKPETKDDKGKENKARWDAALVEIIIRAVVGGGIGTFATSLSSSELPKLALGGLIGGGVAPIVLAAAEPITKKLKQGASSLGKLPHRVGRRLFKNGKRSYRPLNANIWKR